MPPDVERQEPGDLRTQVRATVRTQIARTAFRVFAERGFEQTTAADVAGAAGISRATFFRYFSCKEEAIFVAQEAVGAEIAAGLAGRPTDEDAWVALRRAFDVLSRLYSGNREEVLARSRLTIDTPTLRAHELERQEQWQRMLDETLASRLEMSPTDIQVETLVGAALGALEAAKRTWIDTAGAADLAALIDEAFAILRPNDLGPPLRGPAVARD